MMDATQFKGAVFWLPVLIPAILIIAAQVGHVEDVEELLKLGSDIEAEDDQHYTVDHHAQEEIRDVLSRHRRKLAQRLTAPVVPL